MLSKLQITLILFTSLSSSLLISCKGEDDKAFDNVPNQVSYTTLNSIQPSILDNIYSVEEIPDSLITTYPENLARIPVRNIGQLSKVFNDSNHLQLKYAQALGIKPIQDLKDAYHTRRPILKITSSEIYHLDTLSHSLPFLVPEAADLLSVIGENFIDSLKSRGASGYIIKVTSLLRTPYTVKKLRKVNTNATESSTHQFGTTFDISYTKFHRTDSPVEIHDGDLKNLLAEVLLDLRNSGRCLVKFEKKTACFHITVTK